MGKNIKNTHVPVEIEFTDGYQKRFTEAILKIYEKRRKENSSTKDDKSA